jgi:hypothetical protein
MEPRRASLRKRPATDGTPVQEDAGSRAKRAASAYLASKESVLRQVAEEFGVQASQLTCGVLRGEVEGDRYGGVL